MTRAPQVHLLLRGPEVDLLPAPLYGTGSPADRVTRLAGALATSPTLADMGPAHFVVRQHPETTLAVIGEFDEADQVRLGALRHTLDNVLPTTRYITFQAVEGACRHLAERLVERFGPSRLRRSRFRAIPRGGYIVLGMLSYLLDFDDLENGDGPLVVVDDCSITGVRFREFLDANGRENEVLFAHLYSTPELRQAIERTEPRVLCVSGDDLRDLAPERLGPGHEAWQRRWRERTGETAYWLGQPEHIVFPWSEPDRSFWNSVTNREERGWTLAPPDRSLKSNQYPPVQVFVLPNATGELRPHPDALWARIGERIIVGNLETEAVVSLDGSAAAMWEALATEDSEEAVLGTVSTLYDVAPGTLRKDLSTFVDDLQQRRLVV